jgi:CRISPR-associated Csx2 family protein
MVGLKQRHGDAVAAEMEKNKMTTKVISFLGTSVKPTKYSYKEQVYEGSLFQIALRQFMKFDEMLVFVTKGARKIAYPVLEELNDPRIKPIDIRTGRTSEGLWDIFNTVVKTIDNDDTVIFDITHGLRSIPFLTFLVAAYLRSAKNIKIEAVLYGAFDLGQGGPAPVIDLSEFVSLLDWLTATNQFIKTGNATALAKQLSQTQEPTLLPLAETVEGIATGLHLLRPKETSAAAAALSENLDLARETLPPPFALLADSVQASYGRFGQTEKTEARDQLIYQLEMINWYHRRGQIVHALSMAREWVISFLCVHFGLDTENRDERNEMEFLIGGGKLTDRETGQILRESRYLEQWSNVPQANRLRKLWVKGAGYELAELRNDVLHSGFRKDAKSAFQIITEANKVIGELNSIANELEFRVVKNPRAEFEQ